MRAGLPKANDTSITGMRSVGSGTGITGMSESRQLSVVKTRHMAVLVTGTFLLYSTVSTIVFQVCWAKRAGQKAWTWLQSRIRYS